MSESIFAKHLDTLFIFVITVLCCVTFIYGGALRDRSFKEEAVKNGHAHWEIINLDGTTKFVWNTICSTND
jgi:hypothetical protein